MSDLTKKVVVINEDARWQNFEKYDTDIREGDKLIIIRTNGPSKIEKGEIVTIDRIDVTNGMESTMPFLVTQSSGRNLWIFKSEVIPYGDAALRIPVVYEQSKSQPQSGIKFDWTKVKLPVKGDTLFVISNMSPRVGRYVIVIDPPSGPQGFAKVQVDSDTATHEYMPYMKPLLRVGDEVVCISGPPYTAVNRASVKIGDVYTILESKWGTLRFKEKVGEESSVEMYFNASQFDHVCLHMHLPLRRHLASSFSGIWDVDRQEESSSISSSIKSNQNVADTDKHTSIQVPRPYFAIAGSEGNKPSPLSRQRSKAQIGREDRSY